MVKLIWLLVRKQGITHHQFRAHYENVHSRMGKKYIGHLLCGYVRNYPSDVRGTGGGPLPMDWKYDCVAEWHLPDQAALDEVWRILKDPQVAAAFRADEPNFLDLTQSVLVTCGEGQVVANGTTLLPGEAV